MLTSDIDVDRSIVTFRNEDGKTELTISTAPLADVEATPAAHLTGTPCECRNRAETDRGDRYIAYRLEQLHSH